MSHSHHRAGPDPIPSQLQPALSRLQELVRRRAHNLLSSGRVRLVIGHAPGWQRRWGEPLFVTEPAGASRLTAGPHCQTGLGKYLLDETTSHPGRVALIGRGCDILAARRLIADRRIAPEQVVLVWLPCAGREQPGAAPGTFARTCLDCDARMPEPVEGVETIAFGECEGTAGAAEGGTGNDGPDGYSADDSLIGWIARAPLPPRGEAAVSAGGQAPQQDPYDEWSRWFDSCLRCYACRAACPACHCHVCVLESREPRWVELSTDLPQQFMFHFIRAMDVAGRCVSCGECERACPMGIPLMDLQRAVAADITELFGVKRPHVPAEAEPLGQFELPDPDPERRQQ